MPLVYCGKNMARSVGGIWQTKEYVRYIHGGACPAHLEGSGEGEWGSGSGSVGVVFVRNGNCLGERDRVERRSAFEVSISMILLLSIG